MPSVIPTDNKGRALYDQTATLDGTVYLLHFQWNTRENCWYLRLTLPSGYLIAQGIKIVCNFPLLYKLADSNAPLGEIFAIAPSYDDSPPGFGDFANGRVTLYYFEHDEVPSLYDRSRL